MTLDSQGIGFRVGTVALVLLTMAAVIFGIINFQQRLSFQVPDDGVSWTDSARGVEAIFVSPNSPGERAGIKAGDVLVSIDGQPVGRAIEVVKRLWTLGVWSQARYQVHRQDRSFETRLITA